MSVSYTSILWNKQKKRYDLALFVVIVSFLSVFVALHVIWHPSVTLETIIIRSFGWMAILLLHMVLVIGPLSRIDKRFLVVLYNRRHLGVTMFVMAAIHGIFSILNFHSLSNTNPIRSVFLSNLKYGTLEYFPFQVLGFLSLIVLALMATSSHDFWLKNLGVRLWKGLHMLVYLAYSLLILHVLLGGLQNETSPYIFNFLLLGFVIVVGLHLWSGIRERKLDAPLAVDPQIDFIYACNLSDIPNNRAITVVVSNERVAIYKYDSKLSAVNNVCRHQGGPIGEGKVVDGCITCPWHGYQYLPGNGQSPPPFTEKLETYFLKLEGEKVFINPKPNPPGTEVEPVSY